MQIKEGWNKQEIFMKINSSSKFFFITQIVPSKSNILVTLQVFSSSSYVVLICLAVIIRCWWKLSKCSFIEFLQILLLQFKAGHFIGSNPQESSCSADVFQGKVSRQPRELYWHGNLKSYARFSKESLRQPEASGYFRTHRPHIGRSSMLRIGAIDKYPWQIWHFSVRFHFSKKLWSIWKRNKHFGPFEFVLIDYR